MESTPPPRQQRLSELRRKLTAIAAESAQIEDEIAELESDAVLKLEAQSAAHVVPSTPAEKVALFLDLLVHVAPFIRNGGKTQRPVKTVTRQPVTTNGDPDFVRNRG